MSDQEKQHYSVWFDGSAFSHRQRQVHAGAGWVIRNDDTGKIDRHYASLSETGSGSCLVAEFNAAARALMAVPAGAAVKLHTDSLAVKNYLNDGRLPKMRSSSEKTKDSLNAAAALLWEAQKQHDMAPVEWKTEPEDRRYLRRAHHLARYGAKQQVFISPQ